ncbi:MAG: hypothetical protein HY098_07675 [Nitrospinae bacterium]|nr:hypothetical protein [Nitrospinota bacterium]
MNIEETRRFASAIGMPDQHLIADMDALVHVIQLEMGCGQCFNSDVGCPIEPHLCMWLAECKNSPLNHPEKNAA